MSEMINGKKTEAIRDALGCCQRPRTGCKQCAYHGEILCSDKLKRDAAELIRQQRKTIDERNALLAVMGVSVPEGRNAGHAKA